MLFPATSIIMEEIFPDSCFQNSLSMAWVSFEN